MSQPSMDVGSIVIVEDEPVVRRLMRLWLEADGYTVIEYSKGSEVALHDVGNIAAVCLDLRLEDTSGQGVLAALRSRDPDLPVIVVSGDQELDTAAQAMRDGAYDYVPKPFERERFTQAVHRAVDRRRLSANVNRLKRELAERSAISSFDRIGPGLGMGSDTDAADLAHPPSSKDGASLSDRPGPGDDLVVSAEGAVFDGSTLNLREIERAAIARALKLSGGSVGKAAKLLGIGRATLYRRLSEQRSPVHTEVPPSPSSPSKLNGHEAARP